MSFDGISPRPRASRREGARSRGPQTAVGRACVAASGLGHGAAAPDLMLLDDEDPAAFAAFEAAARRELAPAGALQADLVRRIVSAAWRAQRADRLEAGLMGHYLPELPPLDERERQAAFGLGLIRDGNGPRAFETRWPEPAPISGGRCARSGQPLPRLGAGRAVPRARGARGAPVRKPHWRRRHAACPARPEDQTNPRKLTRTRRRCCGMASIAARAARRAPDPAFRRPPAGRRGRSLRPPGARHLERPV